VANKVGKFMVQHKAAKGEGIQERNEIAESHIGEGEREILPI